MPFYKLAMLLILVIAASAITIFVVQTFMPLEELSPLWAGLILLAVMAVTIVVRLWPIKSRDNEHR